MGQQQIKTKRSLYFVEKLSHLSIDTEMLIPCEDIFVKKLKVVDDCSKSIIISVVILRTKE
jgi:hypothetical protein